MTDLHLPWLEGSILLALIGTVCQPGARPHQGRKWCLIFAGLVLASTIGAWLDFEWLDFGQTQEIQADDAWHLLSSLVGREVLVIDHLSAPLLPLVAMLYF